MAESHFLEGALQMTVNAASSDMAWQTIVATGWDEPANEDPVLFLRLDVDTLVDFCLDRYIYYYPGLFPLTRSDVDVYVREY